MATPTTQKHFRIFDLPQELTDLVFDFAYGGGTGDFIAYVHFQHRRQHSYQEDETRQNFINAVEPWIVSKRWFVAAAQACVERREVSTGNQIKSTYYPLEVQGCAVLCSFATRLHGSIEDLKEPQESFEEPEAQEVDAKEEEESKNVEISLYKLRIMAAFVVVVLAILCADFLASLS